MATKLNFDLNPFCPRVVLPENQRAKWSKRVNCQNSMRVCDVLIVRHSLVYLVEVKKIK